MMKGNSEALRKYQEDVASGLIYRTKAMTPLEKASANPKSLRLAINAHCYECVGYQRAEVTNCIMDECALWNVRPWQKKS